MIFIYIIHLYTFIDPAEPPDHNHDWDHKKDIDTLLQTYKTLVNRLLSQGYSVSQQIDSLTAFVNAEDEKISEEIDHLNSTVQLDKEILVERIEKLTETIHTKNTVVTHMIVELATNISVEHELIRDNITSM